MKSSTGLSSVISRLGSCGAGGVQPQPGPLQGALSLAALPLDDLAWRVDLAEANEAGCDRSHR